MTRPPVDPDALAALQAAISPDAAILMRVDPGEIRAAFLQRLDRTGRLLALDRALPDALPQARRLAARHRGAPLDLVVGPAGVAWSTADARPAEEGAVGRLEADADPWAAAARDLPALLPRPGDWGILAVGGDAPDASAHARLARRQIPIPWPASRLTGLDVRARRIPGAILVETVMRAGRLEIQRQIVWAVPLLPETAPDRPSEGHAP